MNNLETIADKMPIEIGRLLLSLPEGVAKEVEEIRVRCGHKILICCGIRERKLDYVPTQDVLKEILNRLIQFSYYAYEDDLAKGFITMEGGHRIGICGKAVVKGGETKLLREISSLNIRFAREVKGCCRKVLSAILKNGKPTNVLIVSPPGCGKTTLLRDIARELSDNRFKVGICDERSEIAAMYRGIPGFDLGKQGCDVIDGCSKWEGLPILIRGMAPDVIITDEIGRKEDINPLLQCLTSGVKVITSIHGNSMDDLEKSNIGQLIKSHVFQRYVFLSAEGRPGTVKEIVYD